MHVLNARMHGGAQASEVAAKEVLRQMIESLQERVAELEGDVDEAREERARVSLAMTEAREERNLAREDAVMRQKEVEAVTKEVAAEREARERGEKDRQRELMLLDAERAQVEALQRDLLAKDEALRHSRQMVEKMQNFVADRGEMRAGIEESREAADVLRRELERTARELGEAQMVHACSCV